MYKEWIVVMQWPSDTDISSLMPSYIVNAIYLWNIIEKVWINCQIFEFSNQFFFEYIYNKFDHFVAHPSVT